MKKRILSLLIALVMVVSLLPMAVFADGGELPDGASKTLLGESGVQITGIAGLENLYFDTMEHAYKAVRAILSAMPAGSDALGQGSLQNIHGGPTAQAQFDAVYNQKTSLPGHDGAKLTWTIYGEVEIPDSIDPLYLSGGRKAAWYGSDSMTIREIEVVGGNDTAALVMNKAPTMPYQWWGPTTDDYLSFKMKGLTINPKEVGGKRQFSVGGSFREEFDYAIENCTINGNIYFYFNGTSKLTVKDCTFHGNGNESYAFMAQGHESQPLTINFTGNKVSDYIRGINIDQVTAAATITGNEITPGKGYSAIQISGCEKATIENNIIHCDGSNFLTFHENLAKNQVENRSINVKNNDIDGTGYLIYDDITASTNDTNNYSDINTYFDLNMENNVLSSTIDTTQGVKGEDKYDSKVELKDGAVIVQENPSFPPIISGIIAGGAGSMMQRFVDVTSMDYYFDAVQWAVESGITTGTSKLMFSPDAPCTRAQAVTFLWRAMGSRRAETAANFTDVASDAYYADAVAWAVEKGITNGTSDTTFSPDAICTRSQIVTFLYRAIGEKSTADAGFSDVAANAYYTEAVNWAAQYGITGGTGANRFSPDMTCTRAQIVTFLYRAN